MRKRGVRLSSQEIVSLRKRSCLWTADPDERLAARRYHAGQCVGILRVEMYLREGYNRGYSSIGPQGAPSVLLPRSPAIASAAAMLDHFRESSLPPEILA